MAYKVSYSSDGTRIFINDVTDVSGMPISTPIMNIDTQTEEFLSFAKKALRYKDLMNMLESDSRITQIKAVREMYGLGLREAKDLVDSISVGADKRRVPQASIDGDMTLGDILKSAMNSTAKSTYKYDAGNK